MPRALIAFLVGLAVTLTGSVPAHAAPRAKSPVKARLATFDSCAQLTRFARRNVARATRPGAVLPPPLATPAPPPLRPMPETARGGEQPAAMPVSAQAPAAAGEADTSATNVQEAGVDEPDVVKVAGTTVYVVSGGDLLSVDVAGAQPRIVGSLPLRGWGHELLVHGDRLLLLSQIASSPFDGPAELAAMPYQSTSRLTELDASDPASLRVVRSQDVEGSYVTARLHQGTARVVVASWPSAVDTPTPAAERAAADWLPQTRVTSPRGGGRARLLTGCDDVARPPAFSGLGTVTVMTVDLAGEGPALPAADTDAIVANPSTVYASTKSLYVATQAVMTPVAAGEEAPPATTTIHRFNASQRRETAYRSSGAVTGSLLNQFSLSEHDGVLRAATTEWPTWFGAGAPRESESSVTTLAERDGRLVQAGRVGGLGRGERIYAVRFLGDVGYVVTFRQTDPLYTVDLADPAQPRVLGELKINGYSAYLHPVGDGLLLGVGQDATSDGRRTGSQVSLFDVRDLRAPRRIAQAGLGEYASSPVEFDHHAFLHWPATGLAVVPVSGGWRGQNGQGFSGAIGLRVSRDGLTEAGRAEHRPREWPGTVRRALVVGGRLVTISDEGLEVGALDTLAEQGFVAFPVPPAGPPQPAVGPAVSPPPRPSR